MLSACSTSPYRLQLTGQDLCRLTRVPGSDGALRGAFYRQRRTRAIHGPFKSHFVPVGLLHIRELRDVQHVSAHALQAPQDLSAPGCAARPGRWRTAGIRGGDEPGLSTLVPPSPVCPFAAIHRRLQSSYRTSRLSMNWSRESLQATPLPDSRANPEN